MSLRELLLRKRPAVANIFSLATHDITTRNGLLRVQVVIVPYLLVSIDPPFPCVWCWDFWGHMPWLSCGNIPSHSINPSSWIMEEKTALFLNWLRLLGRQWRLLCNLTFLVLSPLLTYIAIKWHKCWTYALILIITVPPLSHDFWSICSSRNASMLLKRLSYVH